MKHAVKTYILAALVAVVVLVSYLPAIHNDFVLWDDNRYVYHNNNIRSLDLSFFRWAATDFSENFWEPFTWTTLAIDYSRGGLNPRGYHLTNIVLHALNSFLVVLLAAMLYRAAGTPLQGTGQSRCATRSELVMALVTGMLFGLHPLHVESVAWVSARNDLLYSLFALLSILSYLRYSLAQRADALPGGPLANSRYYLSLALFLLALSSKPTAVVLPAALLLLEWYPLKTIRSWKTLTAALLAKAPFIVLSGVVSIVTLVMHHAHQGMVPLEQTALATRVLVAARALISYLVKFLLPVNLLPFYPYPQNVSIMSAEYFMPVALVCATAALCLAMVRKAPVVMACFLWFLIFLLPVLGLVQVRNVFMADRYLYLPILGPCLLFGWCSASLSAKIEALHRGRLIIAGAAVCAGLAVLLLGQFLTVRQIAIWKNTITLWSAVIEKEPYRVPAAYLNRGWAFKELKQYERALEDFDRAIAVDEDPPFLAYNNRGMVFKELGRTDDAIADLTQAISLAPRHPLAYANRGIVYGQRGETEAALADFTAAIALDPANVDARIGRGLLFFRTNRVELALEDLTRAIQLNPYGGDAYLNRGLAFERRNELQRAKEDYDRAIALDPSDISAYESRGSVLGKMGMHETAVLDFRKACDLGSESGCTALRAAGEKSEP